ncbi:MAG: hypothetical protein GY822_00825 [Deltaproteobacteria bacterium]|nr:hypothetical protein [Deltaproteobacteria bacterium]
MTTLEKAVERGAASQALLERFRKRKENIADYLKAYGTYCWNFSAISDFKNGSVFLVGNRREDLFRPRAQVVYGDVSAIGLCKFSRSRNAVSRRRFVQ